jgi:hypothetical protein
MTSLHSTPLQTLADRLRNPSTRAAYNHRMHARAFRRRYVRVVYAILQERDGQDPVWNTTSWAGVRIVAAPCAQWKRVWKEAEPLPTPPSFVLERQTAVARGNQSFRESPIDCTGASSCGMHKDSWGAQQVISDPQSVQVRIDGCVCAGHPTTGPVAAATATAPAFAAQTTCECSSCRGWSHDGASCVCCCCGSCHIARTSLDGGAVRPARCSSGARMGNCFLQQPLGWAILCLAGVSTMALECVKG